MRFLKVIMLVFFLVFPFLVISFGRNEEIAEKNKALFEENQNQLLFLMQQIEQSNDVESQLKQLLLNFSSKISSSTSSFEIPQIYQQELKDSLPKHEIFIFYCNGTVKKLSDFEIAFKVNNELGFSEVIKDYLKVIGHGINKYLGKPNPLEDKSFAASLRKHTGISIQISQQRDFVGRLQILPSIGRNRALFWNVLPNGFVIVVFIDLFQVDANFSHKVQTRLWKEENVGLAFVPVKIGTQEEHFSNFLERNQKLKIFLRGFAGKRPNTYVFENFEDCLLGMGPFNKGADHRAIIVQRVHGITQRPENERFAFFLLQAFLACFGVFTGVEKVFFQRSPRISVKLTFLLAFIVSTSLPLVGAHFIVQRFFREKIGKEKDNISSNLHKDLVQIDEGFRFFLASHTCFLREMLDDPTIKGQIERSSLIYPDQKEFAQWLAQELFSIIPGSIQVIVSGENNFVRSWKFNKTDPNEAPIKELKANLFIDLVSWHDRNRLRDVNPALDGSGKFSKSKGDGQKGLDKLSFKRELVAKNIQGQIGPLGYMNFTQFPLRLNIVGTLFDRVEFIGVILKVSNLPRFILKWTFSKGPFDGDYLKSSFDRVNSSLASSDVTLGFTGYGTIKDSYPKFEEEREDNLIWINRVFPQLSKISQLSFSLYLPVFTKDTESEEKYIFETLPGEHVKALLAGQRSTAHLADLRKSLENAASLGFIGISAMAIIIGLSSAMYFLRPLGKLMSAADEINAERFNVRLDDSRGDEFGSLGMAFNSMAKGLQERQILEQYVSSSVISAVKESDSEIIAKSGEFCDVTILFSALHGFEEFQKNRDPYEVFEALQEHLRVTDQAVMKFGGEIDKLMGDKIMVIFRHSKLGGGKQAILSALSVVREIKRYFESTNLELSPAIGINSGKVISGILGASTVRLNHTVIGDPVNLAARLGALAHTVSGSRVILSNFAKHLAPGNVLFEKLPTQTVKGKTQTIEAYQLKE
ncbi:HAMP domain-containing protein [bacterium]|nr:HAMP domain-containing protein [bacterium]